MTLDEFKAIWDAHDGWNNCQVIIFDNSGRWYFDRLKYHEVYEDIKDIDGTVVSRRRINNSPKSGLKEDGTKDYMPIKDYLTINEELQTVEMKLFFPGVTIDEKMDPNCKKYGIEVRHIENIQLMIFRDENNAESHIDYPVSAT